MLNLESGSSGTISDFERAVRDSHKVRVRCEVWTKQGNFIQRIYPTDGEIVTDAFRTVRRSLSLTVVDENGTLIPQKTTDLLSPFKGNEIRVWRGIDYLNGTYAEVAQGVFSITDVEVTRDTVGVKINITGEDRAYRVGKLPLKELKSCADGTNIKTLLSNLIEDVDPTIPFTFADTQFTVGNLKFGGDEELNPINLMKEIASGAGQDLYFDHTGKLRTAAIPTLQTGSLIAFDFNEGSNGVTLEVRRALTSEKVYNGIKLSAEGIGAYRRWQSVVYDEDPLSPTNKTTYGENAIEMITRVPRYIPTETTYGTPSTTQTDSMAFAMLQTLIGQPVTLTAVPNPLLNVRDIVKITSTLLEIDSIAMVDRISMPLTSYGKMELEVRAKWL